MLNHVRKGVLQMLYELQDTNLILALIKGKSQLISVTEFNTVAAENLF